MDLKLRMKGLYAGHSIRQTGVVNVNFEFEYSELPNIVPLIQLLNNNIDIAVKTEESKFKIGGYKLNTVRINHDGSSYVRFNAIVDEVENLDLLYGQDLELLVKGVIEE